MGESSPGLDRNRIVTRFFAMQGKKVNINMTVNEAPVKLYRLQDDSFGACPLMYQLILMMTIHGNNEESE